ncbi:cardiolipin synthase [Kineothrix alysoides]|uniref:Cardiolipin synthase n=2 Tax=Kineothrix alysoides TaxID=1469948 RepID=A0A4R1QW01_9FIRM|nr:cardiolipin synthase [Kineothrix alysoides]TCL54440.1 cardiolipin synthase [Kineothrix alysoides]
MKRFIGVVFKIVFSRTMITLILLLIQLFWLIAGFRWLEEYSEVYLAVMVSVSAALLIYIINKDEMPEFKLAWVIPICATPVFGALLYLFIVGDWTNLGMKKRLNKRRKETEEFLHTDERTRKRMEISSTHMANLSRYVEAEGGFPSYGGASVTYFPTGEEKFADLLKELKDAKEFIFLEYFIVERGRMWNCVLEILKEKVKEGVEVRFMYDGMCSLLLLPYSYPKQLEACGIKTKMFSPIIPLLSTAQNNRDHRKILVIDGKTAYTGGVNMADEYINEVVRFGHWKDAAIKVEGDAVKSFTLMFLQMWNISEAAEGDYSKYIRKSEKKAVRSSGFIIPYGDGPATPENVAETIYMDVVNQATNYVHIMTPYFIVDNAMLDVLQYAARRGVDVKLIVPHIPDKKAVFAISRTYYPDLLGAGVKVYEYEPGFIHAKVFVSDDEKAVVGTVNLDYRSLYHHFECGVYLYRNEAVADVEADFAKTLKSCIEINMAYYKKIPVLLRLTGRVLRLFGPLM